MKTSASHRKAMKKYYQSEKGEKAYRRANQSPKGKIRQIYHNAKNRSKQKHLAFDLDINWIKKRMEMGVCEITGIPFKTNSNATCAFSPSIDRKIPAKGYTKENCQMIVFGLNALKNSGSYSDALLIAEKFIEKQRSRRKYKYENRQSKDLRHLRKKRFIGSKSRNEKKGTNS
jgi:hypothetical protein